MDQFCLKWSDFKSNTESCFKEARQTGEFSDVTLLCEDKQISAHRLVLSEGSSFFQEAFRKVSHPHPVVYLKGVKKKDIEAVLDFLYNGEAKVALEDLSTFFETTKDLKIRGILERADIPKDDERLQTTEDNVHGEIDMTEGNIDFFNKISYNKDEEIENTLDKDFDYDCYKEDKAKDEDKSEINSSSVNKKYSIEDSASKSGHVFKPSPVWQHCTKINAFSAICNICNKELTMSGGSTKTMLRHLQKFHYMTFDRKTANYDVSGAPTYDSGKKSSPVWNHCTRLNRDLAKCDSCAKIIPCTGGTTKGLARHLTKHHNIQMVQDDGLEDDKKIWDKFTKVTQEHEVLLSLEDFSRNETGEGKRPSLVWKYFERLGEGEAICSLCGKVANCLDGSSSLNRHLITHTKQHAGKLKEHATCNECHWAIELNAGSKVKLYEHLEIFHSNVLDKTLVKDE